MNDSISSKPALEPIVVIRRSVLMLAIATCFLMALGSATRVMNAGLACPDWPLCYGAVIPAQQMNLQVFLEWFHRLVASSIGFLTVLLTGITWWYRTSVPKWLPWGITLALFMVIFQGVLGGLTVIELLRFDIVTAHLGMGLMFFSTLLTIAMSLVPHQPYQTTGRLPWLSMIAAILVYGQSILGGLVASRWAVHQCLTSDELCHVLNYHFMGVVPASLATLIVFFVAWRTPSLHPTLRILAYIAGGFLLAQLTIGFATYRLHLQVEPLTVMHQAVGAGLLGTLVSLTVLSLRDAKQPA